MADAALQTLESGKSRHLALKLGRSGMRQYFEAHLAPLRSGDRIQGCVILLSDETAIRRTERMRRDFVANVSHELRTPLSAIHGYAETLLEGALDEKDLAWDFVNVIFRHSQRLSQLVTDLLDLSKLESPDFQPELTPTALNAMIQRVYSLAESNTQGKRLTFRLKVADPLGDALANVGGLEQVLTNLLDNAIKYTPEGGVITLTAQENAKGMIQISVSDTGIGIEPKHIPRLFERFYRVDKARSRDMGGTGLGLSIVKHIISYHGGDIWVESVANQGSTFHFTLRKAS
ncbi:MAG: GHKL domain-containing protein [Vampirovibrionales bacterium]|nr:GHKL domain-containing protein [Vampirovibrionales bacterium]